MSAHARRNGLRNPQNGMATSHRHRRRIDAHAARIDRRRVRARANIEREQCSTGSEERGAVNISK